MAYILHQQNRDDRYPDKHELTCGDVGENCRKARADLPLCVQELPDVQILGIIEEGSGEQKQNDASMASLYRKKGHECSGIEYRNDDVEYLHVVVQGSCF